MESLILITGGTRSGKSRMALELSQNLEPKIFVATAEPRDGEMKERILQHRRERGAAWRTIEEPYLLKEVFVRNPEGVLVVDCLTLWLSNALERTTDSTEIASMTEGWLGAAKSRKSTTILVTNEVGMGIVPSTPLGRSFRDLCGELNQQVAAAADRVIFMISGLPLYLK
jgi:adenosylcobinamide kinase/adenosylcobinamide-phosphate guanylyltransferase